MTGKSFETVLVTGAVLGAISIWLICAIVSYDVIMRFAGRPTLWALEISTYLMIGVATFGSGLAVIRGDHFAVDFLPSALREIPRRGLSIVTNLICLGLMLFVAYGFWRLMSLSIRLDMKSATILRIPLIFPQVGVFLGFALMALAFAFKAFFRKG